MAESNGNGLWKWAIGTFFIPIVLTAVAWGVSNTKIENLEKSDDRQTADITRHDTRLDSQERDTAVILDNILDMKRSLDKIEASLAKK